MRSTPTTAENALPKPIRLADSATPVGLDAMSWGATATVHATGSSLVANGVEMAAPAASGTVGLAAGAGA